MIEAIIPNLTGRINAHIAVFGEPPKALFVNRFELRALALALSPLMRFQNDRLAERGVPNLMLKGVPVVSTDNDTVFVAGSGL